MWRKCVIVGSDLKLFKLSIKWGKASLRNIKCGCHFGVSCLIPKQRHKLIDGSVKVYSNAIRTVRL